MTLEQFYNINQSGTRVYLNGIELKIDQFTKTNLYIVISFRAICEDLIAVDVELL